MRTRQEIRLAISLEKTVGATIRQKVTQEHLVVKKNKSMEIGHYARGDKRDTNNPEGQWENIKNPETWFLDRAQEGKWKTRSNWSTIYIVYK